MMQALLSSTISQTTFDTWVSNYFGQLQAVPPPYVITASAISQLINYPNVDCDFCIQLTGNPNQQDNNDIVCSVVPLSSQPVPGAVYYSMTLFNAFFSLLNPIMPIADFAFTKAAKPGQGQPAVFDIIFQTTFTDPLTAPVCWDLSSSIPPNLTK